MRQYRGSASGRLLLLALALFLLLSACQSGESYLLVGSREERRVLRSLLHNLDQEEGPTRFVLIRTVSDILARTGHAKKQILFLTQYVERNPQDPFNSFYLLLVAQAYENLGAVPLANHYYDRILKNYPDITVGGTSVHYLCLSRLIARVQNKEVLIEYYKELISRFGDYIDIGTHWFYLAEAYEDVGSWDLAIQAYKRFLQFEDTRIPGRPDVHKEIAQKVAFYDSKKDWTVRDLQFLVQELTDITQNLISDSFGSFKLLHFFQLT